MAGLDLSLARAAVAVAPPDWRPGDWGRLAIGSWPTEGPERGLTPAGRERARAERVEAITELVTSFLSVNGATAAFVEDYAFSKRTSSVTALGELRGSVRSSLLRRLGLVATPVPSSSVRKLLLGHNSKGAKVLVEVTLRAMGAPVRNDDEADALAVLNWGFSECGGVALTVG